MAAGMAATMPLRAGQTPGRELANAGGCPSGLVCTNEIGTMWPFLHMFQLIV